MGYLSSGLAYVQDERYAAGAGMRGSGLFQFCTTFSEQNFRQAIPPPQRPSIINMKQVAQNYKDVFVPCPGKQYRHASTPPLSK